MTIPSIIPTVSMNVNIIFMAKFDSFFSDFLSASFIFCLVGCLKAFN